MSAIKAFPKILRVGTDYIQEILDGEVEITEKIDGSQFSFGKLNGEVMMRSKGRMMYPEAHDKMFGSAVQYVMSIQDKLPDGLAFYCEYLQRPRHNVLKYDRVPVNNLALFGVMEIVSEKMLPIEGFAEHLGIEQVPVLYQGVADLNKVINLLDTESILGGCKIEGVVVKNYNKHTVVGSIPLPLMAGKLVSEQFKEVKLGEDWSKDHTNIGKWGEYKKSFCTEARWEKAVQHLRDDGALTNSVKDIGKIIGAAINDIKEEEINNIKTFLWNHFGKELLRGATNGLPEWYKNKLLMEACGNDGICDGESSADTVGISSD